MVLHAIAKNEISNFFIINHFTSACVSTIIYTKKCLYEFNYFYLK